MAHIPPSPQTTATANPPTIRSSLCLSSAQGALIFLHRVIHTSLGSRFSCLPIVLSSLSAKHVRLRGLSTNGQAGNQELVRSRKIVFRGKELVNDFICGGVHRSFPLSPSPPGPRILFLLPYCPQFGAVQQPFACRRENERTRSLRLTWVEPPGHYVCVCTRTETNAAYKGKREISWRSKEKEPEIWAHIPVPYKEVRYLRVFICRLCGPLASVSSSPSIVYPSPLKLYQTKAGRLV